MAYFLNTGRKNTPIMEFFPRMHGWLARRIPGARGVDGIACKMYSVLRGRENEMVPVHAKCIVCCAVEKTRWCRCSGCSTVPSSHPFASDLPHGAGASCQAPLPVGLRGRVGLTGRCRRQAAHTGLFTTGFIAGDRERSIRRHLGYAQLPPWASNPR